MDNTIYLALYKGKGTFPGSYLIRMWTKSKYSHCELVIDGTCYSSSLMDGGVRKKDINLTSDNWDLIPLSWVDKDRILSYFEHTKDRSYDWWGLFGSQIVNRRSDLKKASFCSEWCAAAAGLPNPETYNPGTLGEYCKWMESLQKKYV